MKVQIKFTHNLAIPWLCLLMILSLVHTLAQAQNSLAVISGQIRDAETGFPLLADVTLVEPDTGLSDKAGFRNVMTDSLGNYELMEVIPGDSIVIVKCSGYGIERKLITVGSRQLLDNTDFELNKIAIVSGRVVGEYNIPVAGAVVRAIYTAYPPEIWKSFIFKHEVGEAKTNDLGEFVLPAITPYKEFYLEASSDKHPPKFSDKMMLYSEEASEGIEIRLEKGVTISGTVVDDLRNPVAGARVRLRALTNSSTAPLSHSIEIIKRKNQVAVTGADGEFVFEGVSTGDKDIIVTHAQHDVYRQATSILMSEAVDGVVNIQAVMQRR